MPEKDTTSSKEEVEAYKRGILERNKARLTASNKEPIPNLAEAHAMYDVERDGPATMAQMAEAQKRMKEDPPQGKRVQLAEGTVAGLKALKEASDKANEAIKPKDPVPVPVPEDDGGVLEEFPALGALQGEADPVKNKSEREAIAARVGPIDITEGIVNGEFRQMVPIVPGKFEIEFRTPSPVELQRVRVMLMGMVDKDPRLEFVLGEMLSLMTLVTQIVSINGKVEPPHMIGDSQYSAEFNEEVFEHKLNRYMRYPAPMIYSMGTHCDWFQLRVKQCFTSENLKNG